MELSAAHLAVRRATQRLGIDLVALVAEVGIWAHRSAHAAYVTLQNPSGAARPDIRRARPGSGERAGTIIEGIRLDRNNYAGAAIRAAVGGSGDELAGYQACHVWPESCYDPRFHTVLAKLVLVPAPLVSLTDHDPDVIAALKYRSYELYRWHPGEAAAPTRPARYPATWPEPKAAAPRRVVPAASPPPTNAYAAERRAELPGSQVEVMRRLYRAHGGDRDAVVRAWVAAIRAREVTRKSNERRMSEEEYAKRLIYDGLRKGWLR